MVRGYCAVGLTDPKTAENVGAALRAAGNYGAAFVAQSGARCAPGVTDTMKQHKHLPFLQVENLEAIIPYTCIPVAVDLVEGAIPLPEYEHPERAFYIFGPEDGTLEETTLSWCRDRVYVPTNGSMNLAAAVNVLLYSRLLQQAHLKR